MPKILQAEDIINGRLGTVTVEINGNIVELMELENVKATVEKNKKEVKVVGTLNTQHKATGWKGTGTAQVRFISSRWAEIMQKYVKTGKDTYFTMIITNEDPGSSTGRQVAQLLGCNFDSIDIAKIDIESDDLNQDINFTFDDYNMLETFNEI